jgi:Trk K+ transport system NAD-binding subunit
MSIHKVLEMIYLNSLLYDKDLSSRVTNSENHNSGIILLAVYREKLRRFFPNEHNKARYIEPHSEEKILAGDELIVLCSKY